MKKRFTLVALVVTAALAAAIGASSASAATEFGSGCSAESAFGSAEVSIAHGGGSPLSATAPTSGVITEWKVNAGPFSEYEPSERTELGKTLFQQLYVVKQVDARNFEVVGKSESGLAVIDKTTSFLTRIPVQQGDYLALGGGRTLFCNTKDPADKTVDFRGSPAVGSFFETTDEEPFTGYQVPVVAKIEPDVDGDGYGDETQDKCPQSAAYQSACPVVTVGALPIIGTGAVQVRVTTSLSAPVSVTATVGIGKGKRVSLSAPAQTVTPGSLVPFTLKLTGPIKQTLAQLSPKKALQMKVTAGATNVTGAPSTSVATVKLKGTKKD